MPETKKYYHNLDVDNNKVINLLLNPLTTAQRLAVGTLLTVLDEGYTCYDTTLDQQFFWDGTTWLSGNPSTIWGSITGTITSQTDLITYLSTNYYPLSSNPANYIDLTDLSAGTGISYNNLTGVITNTAPDQTVVLNNGTGISVSGTYPNFTITNTSPSSGGTVTSIATSAPITGGTITTTGTIGITQATALTDGYLSSVDWTTFNNKQSAISLTTTGTSGAATFIANTLNIPQYQAALTNPVTGTGTATRVAFWDTSSSISSDSALYWDNSNKRLGVGTATPAYKLDVNGNESIQGYLNFKPSAAPTSIRISSNDILNGGSASNDVDRLVLIGNSVATNLSLKTSNQGDSLIGIGFGAANSTTTGGIYSVHIGRSSGAGITTGAYNTHIGSGDATNIPSSTRSTIHIVAAGGYQFNNAASVLTGLTSRYAFIGGGFSSAEYINNFYLGAGPFVTDPNLANLAIFAPSGVGTDLQGANFTLNAGRGTGNGTPGDLIFQTSTSGAPGTTLQTLSQRVKIAGQTGNVTINNLSGVGTRMVVADALGVLSTQAIPTVTGGILKGTASGTDTYTTTIAGVSAYNDGDAYLIRFTNGNTTGCTLDINGLGARTLYRNNDGALIGGDIISGGEMFCIYNSALTGFQVIGTAPNTLLGYVTNDDSVTITKGQVVYAFGGQGDRMTVKLASNTSDATSARTVGVVLSTSIAANQKGLIMMQGLLDGLSILPTATYSDGDPIYLGSTAGSITNVKPYAPNHLVYVATVTTASNGSAGRMYVNIQNGYELDELHNVQAQSPSLKDTLWYDNTVTPAQWKTASISTILGYTPVSGTGTTNYVPKFTSASAIGNSQIFDNGTSVGINTASPAASSLLDMTSTARGLLIPRMTTAQINAIASPAQGLMAFDTSYNSLVYYDTNFGDWWSDSQYWLAYNGFSVFDDFMTYSYVTNYNGQVFQIQNANSATWNNVTPLGNRPGVLQMSTGTNAAGRLTVQGDGIQLSSFIVGGGKLVYETDVQIQTLSDGTNTFRFFTGFSSSSTLPTVNSIMFLYDASGISTGSAATPNWQVVCSVNPTRTFTTTSTAVVAGTWYRLKIEINAAGNSVGFYINGVLAATIATNIPTGALTPVTTLFKSAGTTARTAWLDFIRIRQKFTTPR